MRFQLLGIQSQTNFDGIYMKKQVFYFFKFKEWICEFKNQLIKYLTLLKM
jgi:hypothetical protein